MGQTGESLPQFALDTPCWTGLAVAWNSVSVANFGRCAGRRGDSLACGGCALLAVLAIAGNDFFFSFAVDRPVGLFWQ